MIPFLGLLSLGFTMYYLVKWLNLRRTNAEPNPYGRYALIAFGVFVFMIAITPPEAEKSAKQISATKEKVHKTKTKPPFKPKVTYTTIEITESIPFSD